ncbi:hypothetical protein E2562_003801 [Oryza meyeriana var. granulata]|uniref:Uncharacterized protein n=1 Tax=Oryza meyeriana var. granulata TaxID=110450 RepID=A0A6G1BQF8_9ORYZ|nr:hypothetical protein E2562_003801 [Oryza meyeriana var. granulata]
MGQQSQQMPMMMQQNPFGPPLQPQLVGIAQAPNPFLNAGLAPFPASNGMHPQANPQSNNVKVYVHAARQGAAGSGSETGLHAHAAHTGVRACCKARSSRQQLGDGTAGPRGGMQKSDWALL